MTDKVTQLTKEQAITLAETHWWNDSTAVNIAAFQLSQSILCCPKEVFLSALSNVLGREVFTHELANRDQLIAELNRDRKSPSLKDVFALLPEEKTALIHLKP